jgi:hypothetical protein
MNYLKHYVKLMRKAQRRSLLPGVYREKHHIFPISIYGDNKLTVELTFKEHVVAHHLLFIGLVKRYGPKDLKSIKMGWALTSFLRVGGRVRNDYPLLIKLVAKLSEKRAFKHTKETIAKISGDNNVMRKRGHSFETRRKMSKARSGRKHPMWGKKHSEESKRKMSSSKTGVSTVTEEGRRKLSESQTGNKNHNYKPRNWMHEKYGLVRNVSINDLKRMFSQENLSASALCRVAQGKRNYHKGWRKA